MIIESTVIYTVKIPPVKIISPVTGPVPTVAIWGSYMMDATCREHALFPTWFFARISFAIDLLLHEN